MDGDDPDDLAGGTVKGLVTIVIGTYGDVEYWADVAEPAYKSALDQTVTSEVIRSHGSTLMEARNYGAEEATGEWLVFLDADDELDVGYVEAMIAGDGDIRQPSTLGIVNGVSDDFAVLIPKKNLIEANYLIIGSMVRRDLFLDVGGFDDYPILEDWECWIRLVLAGARVGHCPDAIYKVHVNLNSRNAGTNHGNIYLDIRNRHIDAWRSKFE